jgi:hypothetical protein
MSLARKQERFLVKTIKDFFREEKKEKTQAPSSSYQRVKDTKKHFFF